MLATLNRRRSDIMHVQYTASLAVFPTQTPLSTPKMRLLNVHTRRLEEYFGKEIPSYAILSHTWREEEVTFGDINGPLNKAEAKLGYKKLDYASKQAAADGLNYAWVWMLTPFGRTKKSMLMQFLDRHLLHRQIEQRRALGSHQLHVQVVPRRAVLLRIFV